MQIAVMILFVFIQAFWRLFSFCSFFVLLDLKSDLKIVVENSSCRDHYTT